MFLARKDSMPVPPACIPTIPTHPKGIWLPLHPHPLHGYFFFFSQRESSALCFHSLKAWDQGVELQY